MIWTRRGLLVTGLAAASADAMAQGAAGRSAEALDLKRFAETTHPRGREAIVATTWNQSWTGFAATADRLTDGAYVCGLRRLLGWFADGHTTVLPFEFTGGPTPPLKDGPFGLALPISVRPCHDGLWIVAAGGEASTLLGGRITGVNGVSDVELMRRHAAAWGGNNAAWPHRWAGVLFNSCGLLQGLEVIGGPPTADLRLETTQGAVALRPRRLPGVALTRLSRRRRPHEDWAVTAKSGNYAQALPDRRALYLSIDEMGESEGKDFLDFTREAFAAMAPANIERMVIDLRRNGGGDNFLGESLRKHIERSRFNRPGGLYVLIGPQTFSAAQNLANRLERETFAQFVGEPTGGAPNHYGDAKPWQGPVTGVTAIVSTLPWFDSYPMDRRSWILPDLPVPERFADWRDGRDPALEAALGHRDPRPDQDLVRERVFFYARPSQAAEWKPFWRA